MVVDFREVFDAVVAQNRDYERVVRRVLGHTKCSTDVEATGTAHQKPFCAGDGIAARVRLGVANELDTIDERLLGESRHVRFAGSFDRKFFGLLINVGGEKVGILRPDGIGERHEHAIARECLETARHATDVTATARTRHKMRNFAVRLRCGGGFHTCQKFEFKKRAQAAGFSFFSNSGGCSPAAKSLAPVWKSVRACCPCFRTG